MKARLNMGMSKTAQTAFNDEVNRQLAARTKDWYVNLDALILYTLHESFGFGKERLKKFFDNMLSNNEELMKYYQMNDVEFICKTKLKNIGVDVDMWNENIFNGGTNERP